MTHFMGTKLKIYLIPAMSSKQSKTVIPGNYRIPTSDRGMKAKLRVESLKKIMGKLIRG